MASNYPGSLDSFVAKQDGAGNIISAAHINELQNSVVAIETELGTDPAGSLTDLKTRLAVRLNNNGTIKHEQQIVTVAKSNGDYTTIQAAINSISDAASNKIYTVLVFPGEYNEAITLKNYVDIVAINPESTKILQQVTDNNVECVCNLRITIESASGDGLDIRHASTIIVSDGDISSSSSMGVRNSNGTVTVNGNISSSSTDGVYVVSGTVTANGNISSTSRGVFIEGGTIVVNGNISSTYNNAGGHGIYIAGAGGTVTLQNCKIICTHADAKSIYASSAKDCRCMNVWANRNDHANITQLIAGGFNFDTDVQ